MGVREKWELQGGKNEFLGPDTGYDVLLALPLPGADGKAELENFLYWSIIKGSTGTGSFFLPYFPEFCVTNSYNLSVLL